MNTSTLLPADLIIAHQVIGTLNAKVSELQSQLEWFRRQVFGTKSERYLPTASAYHQLSLGSALASSAEDVATVPAITIKEHVRKSSGKQALEDDCGEAGLRYNNDVPVEIIECPPEEIKGLDAAEYEIIDTKVTERLCQRSQYFVKRFLRSVVKLKSSALVTAPAPAAVFERSFADVSLLAGILVDKFQYHIPLFRQHLRLTQCGVVMARGNLTSGVHRSARLLAPISTMRGSPRY